MTDKEILAIVQARIGGKQLEKHEVLAWVDWKDVYETESLNFEKYVYRVKPDDGLPKTWNEYCAKNGVHSQYLEQNMPWISAVRLNGYYNVAKSYTNSFVALAKLIQLRDCYNNYQKPSVSGCQHCICCRHKNGELTVVPLCYKTLSNTDKNYLPKLLCFHTPQIRDKFMENFNDLILEAAELLI